MKKLSMLLLLALLGCVASQAQTNDKPAAIKALKDLTLKYLASPQLGFNIVYYYSTENSPNVFLDSLKGSIKMDGNRYWYSLDSTETLSDTGNIVILYKEDKIMYISKPTLQTHGTNPLALLDSLSLADETLSYSVSTSRNQQIITVQFSKNSAYKEISYYLDANTGLLEKSKAIVKSGQLYDAEVRQQINMSSEYAIIETRFSNYQINSFDSNAFSAAHYFKKEGAEYIPTEQYAVYRIFLGKPGL